MKFLKRVVFAALSVALMSAFGGIPALAASSRAPAPDDCIYTDDYIYYVTGGSDLYHVSATEHQEIMSGASVLSIVARDHLTPQPKRPKQARTGAASVFRTTED